MPPLVIPNTAQVVATGSLAGGENWANVWHVINDPAMPIDQVRADAIGLQFANFYNATKGVRHNGWSFTGLTVRSLDTAGANVFSADVTPATGTGTGVPLPYEVAMVITLHTELNTRRGRGRSYQAGWPAAVNAANADGAPVIGTNATDLILPSLETMLEGLEAINADLGVASRADLNTRKVIGGYIDNGWDTMRQRSDSIATARRVFTHPGA